MKGYTVNLNNDSAFRGLQTEVRQGLDSGKYKTH